MIQVLFFLRIRRPPRSTLFPYTTRVRAGGIVLTKSMTAEGLGQNARGEIGTDGTFRLTTFKTDDGAVPGKHRVLVRAQRDQDDYIKRGIIPRPVIDPRFESYPTSGLEMNVKKASNEFTLVVERPK